MELLLWRWSTAVQVTSMMMIAVFFAALSRSVRRAEVRLWMRAWLVDLAALAIALGFWYFQPDRRFFSTIISCYVAAKTAFVLLMLQGSWELRRPGSKRLRARIVIPLLIVFSVGFGLLVNSTDQLGTLLYPLFGLMFVAGGVALVVPFRGGAAWLAAGFFIRALLLFVESAAYWSQIFPRGGPRFRELIALFISAASSFDSGTEWFIALGCVLAVSNRIQRELRQSNVELIAAQTAADEANTAKSAFLANMSHELRTPLNAVIGFAQIMARSRTMGSEDHENVAVIRRSGEHLLGLINDVLSIAKIEAGKLAIERRAFDPREMLAAVDGMIRGRLEGTTLDLVVALDPALPGAVTGDEGRLRQVLLNLLGNAIKFTRSGSVTIRARWTDGRATFEVSDTGVGIAAEDLPLLFEPFVQSESGKQAKEGFGLGLAISRQLVRLMGGEIEAESVAGEGTTFRFTIDLPLAIDSIERSDVRRVAGLAAGEPSRRALVADDSRESRVLLCKLLEATGFEVAEAANGSEAVEVWKRWRPDLIFMDNRMPVVDGQEATRTIRDLEAASGQRRVVIVAVTASVFEHERGAILANGADDFLMKPFREQRIFDAIAAHLGVRYRYEGEPAADAMKGTRVLLIDDEEISRRVASEVLHRLGLEVVEASSGAEGLKRLAATPFDAVLLDLEMPHLDGEATLRAMRQDERWRNLPVIVMTAHDQEQAMVPGMTGYLAKPLREDEASRLLGRYLRVSPSREQESASQAREESPSTLRVADGLRHASGNASLYEQLLRTFRNGYEDLGSHLRAKIDQRRSGDVALILHSLRGNAATIGAADLAAEAGRLETAFRRGETLPLETLSQVLSETIKCIDQVVRQSVSQHEPPIQAGRAELRAITGRMDQMLRANDLSAIQCFFELRSLIGTNGAPSLAPLDKSIEQLDFDAARIHLKNVESELGIGASGQ